MMHDDARDPSRASDGELDGLLERAVDTLREPVAVSPNFDARVMTHVRNEDARLVQRAASAHPVARRETRYWTVAMRPLAWAAAVLVAIGGLALGLRVARATRPPDVPEVHFVIVAPGARSVAVLGDFNHWDASANPMGEARQHAGTWSATVAVTPGRHVYTFLIDGTRWMADPKAPRSLDDDFGRPTGVLTIVAGGRST